MATASLMRLPLEVRLSIFGYVLNNIFQRLQHPHDPIPKYHAYILLILSCKQIHDEVEDLFMKTHAQRAIFYFEDVPKLYEFFQYTRNFRNTQDIWFNLSLSKPNFGNNSISASNLMMSTFYGNRLREEDTYRFIRRQALSRSEPTLSQDVSFCLGKDVVQNRSLSDSPPIVRTETEMSVDNYDHYLIEGTLDDTTAPYASLVPHESLSYQDYYSPTSKYRDSLQLVTYTWSRTSGFDDHGSSFAGGRKVLEGRIEALQFSIIDSGIKFEI